MVTQIIADILMGLGAIFIIILIILVIQMAMILRDFQLVIKSVRNVTKLLNYPMLKSILGIIKNLKKGKGE